MVSHVRWCLMWDGVSCEMVSCVIWCPVRDGVSSRMVSQVSWCQNTLSQKISKGMRLKRFIQSKRHCIKFPWIVGYPDGDLLRQLLWMELSLKVICLCCWDATHAAWGIDVKTWLIVNQMCTLFNEHRVLIQLDLFNAVEFYSLNDVTCFQSSSS